MVVGLALGEKRRVVGRRLLLILRLAVIIRLRRLLLLLGKTGFSVKALFILWSRTVLSQEHLAEVVALVLNVDWGVLGEGVEVEG